jgi:hypothetical protein
MAFFMASAETGVRLAGLNSEGISGPTERQLCTQTLFTGPEKDNFQYQGAGPAHAQAGKPYADGVAAQFKGRHGTGKRIGVASVSSTSLKIEMTSVRLSILAVILMLATPAFAVELFRYRGAAKDGGTLEYVFEAGEQNSPNAVTKEKAAEIAADFMTTFYHVPVGALETQEFRTQPVPFWLVSFSDTAKGQLRQMFFVVLLPDGTVVVPSVAKRM